MKPCSCQALGMARYICTWETWKILREPHLETSKADNLFRTPDCFLSWQNLICRKDASTWYTREDVCFLLGSFWEKQMCAHIVTSGPTVLHQPVLVQQELLAPAKLWESCILVQLNGLSLKVATSSISLICHSLSTPVRLLSLPKSDACFTTESLSVWAHALHSFFSCSLMLLQGPSSNSSWN